MYDVSYSFFPIFISFSSNYYHISDLEAALETSEMTSNEKRALTEAEMREITEYQKIIEFSEQVLAGKHPLVKLPSQFLRSPNPRPPSLSSHPRLDRRRCHVLQS